MSSAALPGDSSLLHSEKRVGPGIDNLPQLLARLDKDPDTAGRVYEDLRRRLILFFRLRRPQEAEDLADKVLDRVARRLAEGVEIEKVEFYVVGIARFVLRERFAATQRENRAQQDLVYVQQMQATVPALDTNPEANILALGNCLKRLEEAERSMILTYYGADGPNRMRVRQTLAQNLKISLNALHNRALRLRKQLERCVASQMPRGSA
jgi:DNA-directed RNA polymerase specialized sigma24 family protein